MTYHIIIVELVSHNQQSFLHFVCYVFFSSGSCECVGLAVAEILTIALRLEDGVREKKTYVFSRR